MLVKLAEAIGRLVLAGRELTRLAGFTSRVTELMTVLKDLNHGRYQRTMVSNQNADAGLFLIILSNPNDRRPNSFSPLFLSPHHQLVAVVVVVVVVQMMMVTR